jgi:L-iditol 2-dehydrogenase/galactitol-1-phosphate 5-dehydrogenase
MTAQTMNAIAVTGVKTLTPVDLPIPQPGPGQVLIKVAWCGICGSDIPRYFDGAVHSFPQILGHEFSGEVAAVGPEVDSVAVGDRVAVAPLVPCEHCGYCQRGLPALCEHYSFIGSRQQGALAEYVVAPARNAVPLPKGMTLRTAALVEPLTVALHGINRAHLRTGASVLVLGGGVVGLMAASVLLDAGMKVSVCDIDPAKVAYAEGLGARAGADAKALIAESGAPDVVIETAGSAITQAMALTLVARTGQVVFVGTAHRDVVLTPDTFEKVLRGELGVTGSWMSYSAPFPGWEWQAAVDLISKGAVDADKMITGEYDLSEGDAAFHDIKEPAGTRLKLLFRVSGAL